ncbi:flavodoxin domain-containing protein [Listeria welshimeri]|uniref:DNA-directed RNA polymerase I n=1 Tax=Listeria welshimeri TaxID=1643 RepID=A0ABX4IH20_LISWE|nr:flavodoxin domain-containing protein [Listeria welshimeri]MBC1954991.1 DNA-directed RNA polymerase I [Listeria welshimeri]MBC2269555.1 DNA-directed RNA polymerase I [Listeria welshimeri]MBC2334651.1 DNA-directed RNA polymerase I [Listeria welshimeri]MBS9348046.1 DNA-directed RNA polymerase I [Listeria welshimeri]PDK42592.1 DNA-directed RNA polymerase I [Listeria welshimeri]
MNKIIIYSSQYGTSKQYATEISNKKTIPMYSVESIPESMLKADEIIYVGSIYMGKVLGFDKFSKQYNALSSKLIVVSTGMYNPKRKTNMDNIELAVKANLQKTNFLLKDIFYLKGKLDTQHLRFKHKILINTLYKSAKRKKECDLNENERDIVLAYEDDSQIDFNELNGILNSL